MISATGIGTGLDVTSIISQLMAVEQLPLTKLEKRVEGFESQLSAYGKLKSALSTFKTSMDKLAGLSKFEVYSATSTDKEKLTATANDKAVAGSYVIDMSQVGHQLAQTHKMASTMSPVVADANTSIGATGSLTIGTGATSGAASNFTVDITTDTLANIRDAINNAEDNTGVTATIINVSDGSGGTQAKLVLTSDESGTDNQIFVDSGAVATRLNMTTTVAAQDAVFSIDGFEVISSTNTVEDAIEGVTITLLEVGSSETLTIGRDYDSVVGNVQSFVNSYNTLRQSLSTARTEGLSGDSSLLTIESRIRGIFNMPPDGITSTFSSLSELGITTAQGGNLVLDTTKLKEAMAEDYDGVAELFANDDQGYAYRLKALATSFLDSADGLIKTRQDGIQKRIDRLEDDITNLEYRLDLTEARLVRQFSALDSLVSKLQSTGSYLTSQLAGLNLG